MNTEHPVFRAPLHRDATIWRYMDFAKFVSVVSREDLFFSRVDRLGDALEGSVSLQNVDVRKRQLGEYYERAAPQLAKALRDARQVIYANCWHMAEYESAALWETSAGRGGLAIRSTFQKLCEAIQWKQFYVGLVTYVDYENDVVPDGNLFAPSMFKRKSFEHEREVRAVVDDMHTMGAPGELPDGLYVPVDLEHLAVAFHVSPAAPDWLHDVAKNVVEQYGLKTQVLRSDLRREPIF